MPQNIDTKTASQHTHMNGGNKSANGVGNNGTKNNNTSTNNIHYSQQVVQSHNRRSGHQQPAMGTFPLESPSGTGTPTASHHYHHRPHNGAASTTSQPTPLFERLVTEEYQELKAYTRIIEGQNRRLVELERIHGDLENRLELESRGRTQLEATLERRERDWNIKYHKLEKDRDDWKNEVSQEQAKNARLRDQVVRKDQDIHRMLQRKVSLFCALGLFYCVFQILLISLIRSYVLVRMVVTVRHPKRIGFWTANTKCAPQRTTRTGKFTEANTSQSRHTKQKPTRDFGYYWFHGNSQDTECQGRISGLFCVIDAILHFSHSIRRTGYIERQYSSKVVGVAITATTL